VPVIADETLRRLRDDPAYFAETLTTEPLWRHQAKLVRSKARTRCVLAGRQCGKSRAISVLSLHTAFAAPDRLVLLVSATELAARRLVGEIAWLAQAPLLAGSVVDENKSEITLTNGSRIVSVAASERAVRGWSADLLVIDEAALVDGEVIKAARFTTIARGGNIVMASTPWGRRDRPFAVAYEAGRAGAQGYASFHWPSTVSPLVSRPVLEEWRTTMTDREWRAEVLGEWVDEAGAYFTPAELDTAVADIGDGSPEAGFSVARGAGLVGGVDWGMARDASTVVLNGPVGPEHPLAGEGRFWVPVVLERFGGTYAGFIDEAVDLVRVSRFSGGVERLVSELNGVGAMPTESLTTQLRALDRDVTDDERRRRRFGMSTPPPRCVVEGVHTTAQLKENLFGAAKMLFQQGRLLLPRHPSLLRQLQALEFEQQPSGSVSISVPERAGHDDVAMAFALSLVPRLRELKRPATSARQVRDVRLQGRR
jgi:hypothetical protein